MPSSGISGNIQKIKVTHDKHTKPRPGRDNEKKKQDPNWTPRNPRKKP